MALPSSGSISISQIKAELSSSNNSLVTLSTEAGFVAPHSMSDFYGYEHNPGTPTYPEYTITGFATIHSGSCVSDGKGGSIASPGWTTRLTWTTTNAQSGYRIVVYVATDSGGTNWQRAAQLAYNAISYDYEGTKVVGAFPTSTEYRKLQLRTEQTSDNAEVGTTATSSQLTASTGQCTGIEA